MKVVFCSSEVFPFAKTGGLADVSGALPFALAKQGIDVKIFMPLYKGIKPDKMKGDYGVSKINNVEVVFVKNDEYFLRDNLYTAKDGDYPDNLERFSFFSEKIIEILKKTKFSPDIIHCNDWQTCALLIYLKTKYRADSFFKKTKTCLTIHNLAYQGVFKKDKYTKLGIDWKYFSIDCLEFYGKVNLLKGGISFADMVNTVSPTYSEQIKSSEYGCGLEGVLVGKEDKLTGILNAIDYSVWNPAKDKLLYEKYSSAKLEGKAINKKKFQKDLGFEQKASIPILGMVTRLAEQKGLDILSKALPKILKDCQVVILGLGDELYHKLLRNLEKKYKKRLSLHLKFDEAIAHKIYGSCDAFLMPSRFEPCGLSQMMSYKYATIPIVHSTGGLVDTVVDYSKGGGGFVFAEYSSKSLLASINSFRAVFKDKNQRLELLKKISKFNFSWDKTAKQYIRMYESIACSQKCKCGV